LDRAPLKAFSQAVNTALQADAVSVQDVAGLLPAATEMPILKETL